jgi:hypothetical protein
MKDELKLNGDKAVGRKDYLTASKFYGKVGGDTRRNFMLLCSSDA